MARKTVMQRGECFTVKHAPGVITTFCWLDKRGNRIYTNHSAGKNHPRMTKADTRRIAQEAMSKARKPKQASARKRRAPSSQPTLFGLKMR